MLAVLHGPLRGTEIYSDTEWQWDALHRNAMNPETGLSEFQLRFRRNAPLNRRPIPDSLPERFQIFFTRQTGQHFTLEVNRYDSLGVVLQAAVGKLGCCPSICRFLFQGRQLEWFGTVDSVGLRKECTIHIVFRLRGGKPVIYLFPPEHLDLVNVTLTLTPSWTFSAIYPLAEISVARAPSGGSTLTWNVSASSDGKLVDLATNTDISYLFWEAETSGKPYPAPALLSSFEPNNVRIDTSNSIVLPFNAFIPYLNKIPSDLTLHTSARNDFITYWLPKLLRIQNDGKEIAFRFIPEVEFERAVKLEVQPAPDVVTRVFLVFKGVEKECKNWREPEEIDWSTEIGIDLKKARDQKLFRVLEWGAMEIHD